MRVASRVAKRTKSYDFKEEGNIRKISILNTTWGKA